jgi:uncharacterized protein
MMGAPTWSSPPSQVIAGRLWFERFRHGPIEWLWRALMYGRAPPFRNASA